MFSYIFSKSPKTKESIYTGGVSVVLWTDTTGGNENIEDKVKQDSAQLINKLKVWDDLRKIYWYPSVVNMGKLGIIYPDGTLEDWKWKYAKTVPVPKEKQKALSNYSMMLDVDNAVEYERTDFLSAVKEMGIAKDIK